MQEYETDVLKRTAAAEAAAARHAPKYADWWEKSLRRLEREQQRVWNSIAAMNNRAARDAEQAANEYARAQLAADRQVERSRRQAVNEQAALQRALGEMERRSQREQLEASSQAARQRQQMDRSITDTEKQQVRERLELESAAWRENLAFDKAREQAAKERYRLETQAERENLAFDRQAFAEHAALQRALGEMEKRSARDRAQEQAQYARRRQQMDRMVTDTEQQEIRERRRAEQQAEQDHKRELRERERAERDVADASSQVWASFRRYLSTLAAGFGVRQVIEYADTWKLLNARIGNVTNSQAQQAAVEERLFSIAQRTRQPIEQSGLLYTRLAMATEALGSSQSDVLKVTQAVNQAFILTGSTAAEARSATLQLAHAMSENRLQGRQLNSLLMDSPELMRAMVVGMGISQQQLRHMVSTGQVTTEKLFNAILSQADKLDAKFGKMPETVGQAITKLQNSFIRFIGIIDAATGVTGKLSKILDWLGDHVPLLVAMIIAATTAWGTYALTTGAAAVATAALGEAGIITGIINLIKVIRELGAVAALGEISVSGLAGAVALTAALLIGYVAYTEMQKKMTEANKRANDALLEMARGKNTLTDETKKLSKEERNQRIENEKMVQAALQSIELAKVQGMAQEELRINFEAANKAIEARGKFKGALQAETLGAIEEERRLHLIELQTRYSRELLTTRENILRASRQELSIAEKFGSLQTRARIDAEAQTKAAQARAAGYTGEMLNYTLESIDIERRNSLRKAVLDIIQDYRKTVQDTMSGVFEDVMENGIKNFGQLFNTVRKMWFKMIADMLATRFMEGMGKKLADSLARMFGGLGALRDNSTYSGPHGQLSPLDITAQSLSAAGASLQTAATALTQAATTIQRAAAPPNMTRVDPTTNTMSTEVGLGGVTATASRKQAHAFATEFAKYAGVALAGFMGGYAIGGMTTNRGLGVVGGAAAGAAQGAMIGSAIPGVGTVAGGIIGAVAGGIGGLLGSNKKREERDRERNQILTQNGQRIVQLREMMAGDLMRGSNLAKALQAVAAYQGKSKNDLESAAKRFGLTMAQLDLIAQNTGIQLYDSAGKIIPGALKQLQEALQLTAEAATHFTNSLNDVELQQEAYNKLFNIPDTSTQRLKDSYAILEKMAPDLLKQMGLANLNLDSDAGRNVLLKGLQDIFKMIQSGQMTPELLGAFTDKGGLIEAILKAKEGLDAFNNVLGNVTTDFPKVIDLVIFEQRRGTGTAINPQGAAMSIGSTNVSVSQGPSLQIGSFTVNNYGSEIVGEKLLNELEDASGARESRGGRVRISGLVVTT